MSTEISIEERIEAARARLKTAYDRMIAAPADIRQSCEDKWKQRKKELEQIISGNQSHLINS